MKQNRYFSHPNKYFLIIINGVNQAAFVLLHFAGTAKDFRGESIKVELPGLLNHVSLKTMQLYTMTYKLNIRADHII